MSAWIWGAVAMIAIVIAGIGIYRHQCRLRDRAHLMREAIYNRDFTFHLPTRGLLFGERALQETLNDLGQVVNQLVAQNEVESWQRLTRVLTHEIMNVTTPIQSITQAYLSHPMIKGTPYEEGIRVIHDTSAGLAIFVSNYRKLTQLEEPQPTAVNLRTFASELQTLYPDLVWHISIPASVTLRTDKHLLRQALINLIKNAIEAGARTIDLRWQEALYISNDGEPIPAAVRQEIFVPFFTTKSSGSGIGLSLSRQILIRQGILLSLADTPVCGYHVSFVLKSS
ncbi:HAMP domain-containing histidine kinase [Parabacteroides distasonis]|nr:HAMP domain-containing histidine kinase [Parabacteroides distasonis]MCI6524040.1 HAMP domain-containing histidine kinase [Parabacteroides sp.]MCI7781658.1 HAMP domain-containing histidine kinase [Parabacteroides sp.]MDD7063258.1 HAMP domain-containing sensor histidine kinase [bacterium]